MAATFVLSSKAKSDLDAIWDHSVEEWGDERAERYVREFGRVIEYLAQSPERGRRCDDIREGYQKYPAGSHVIFYRLHRKGIDVVRILYQHMDFERHI